MDRTSFRAAALAAMASLVIAGTDARADPGGPAPDPVTASTEPSAQPAAPAETTAPGEGSQDVATTEESSQPQASSDASTPDPRAAPAADGAESVTPAPSQAPPPSSTGSLSGQDSEAAPPTSNGGPQDTPHPPLGGEATRAPGPGTTPFVLPPVPAAPVEPGSRGGGLEQVLTTVERELRTVEGQIGDLRRRLEHGAPLPTKRLARLRSTLEQIAPALAALGIRLDGAGQLDPRLRELVRRVQTRVTRVRASARGLAAAVSRSGVRSPELRRLLHALEGFRALSAALVPGAGLAPAPSRPGAGSPSIHMGPPIVASRWQALGATAEGHVAGRDPIAPRERGQPDEPPPWTSDPGSTTAAPGGAFAAAGLALLAMLLIAAAQAQQGARLEFPPRRRYAAAFPAPLERPG